LLRPVGRDQKWLDFGRPLSAEETTRWMDRLQRRSDVDWVEPNTLEQPLAAPADPMFAQQWWLRPAGGTDGNALPDRLRGVAGFLSAWESGIPGASSGATVAVLDTGITAHPELDGRTWPGHDFVSDAVYGNDGDGRDADPSDPGDWVSSADLARPEFAGCQVVNSSWHGTIVAGLVVAASDNGIGVAGIQRAGKVLPVRVAGKCGASVSDIVDGMRWAAGLPVPNAPPNTHPARVLNVSFGGSAACGSAYQTAIDELHAHGVVVVAAAGNGWGEPSRPANCSGVVGVAALNRDGFKANYSNFGSVLTIATTGGDDTAGGSWGGLLGDGGLVTLWNDGTRGPGGDAYAALFGTSFAAPLVSGTAALMLGVNPALTADQIVAGLRLSARPHVGSLHIGGCSAANPGRCLCTTTTCGAGILDAAQALRYAVDPAAYTPPVRAAEMVDDAEVVAAAALGPDRPGEVPAALAPADSGEGHGGGAFSIVWLAALAVAVVTLTVDSRTGRRPPRSPAA
jgi:serine protease